MSWDSCWKRPAASSGARQTCGGDTAGLAGPWCCWGDALHGATALPPNDAGGAMLKSGNALGPPWGCLMDATPDALLLLGGHWAAGVALRGQGTVGSVPAGISRGSQGTGCNHSPRPAGAQERVQAPPIQTWNLLQ